jgi:hypothetical protein
LSQLPSANQLIGFLALTLTAPEWRCPKCSAFGPFREFVCSSVEGSGQEQFFLATRCEKCQYLFEGSPDKVIVLDYQAVANILASLKGTELYVESLLALIAKYQELDTVEKKAA